MPRLRLGVLAMPADSTGLIAVGLGYVGAKLSPAGTQLLVTAYTSPAAESAALEAGTIDAAYTTPAAARAAWQHTSGGIRVIAGATDTKGGTPAVVLAASTSYLHSHGGQVTDLLEGDIQAIAQLTTAPAAATPAARAELQTLLGRKVSKSETTGLSLDRAAPNPGAGPAGLTDLSSFDTLLRASGLPPA
jgi:ABC-type nitrate/sulfonate/bicarbonate transport system substrate-binding protein